MGPGGVEDEPKTENVEFPLVLKHFQLRENGDTTEEQRRYNGETTEKQTETYPRRGLSAVILQFLPLTVCSMFDLFKECA